MIDYTQCISVAKKLYNNCNYIEAIHCFEDLLKNNYNTEECYWYLGKCYEKLDYETKAIENYKKGLALCDNPEFISDYHLNIGKNLLMLSRLSEAMFHFDKSSEFDGNRLLALHNMAMVYICQKDFKKALKILMFVTDNGLSNKRIEQHITFCKSKLSV